MFLFSFSHSLLFEQTILDVFVWRDFWNITLIMLSRVDKVASDQPSTAEVSQSLCSERPKTHKMTDFWLIGHSAPTITGAKLPDCRRVMKLFLHLRHDPENIKKSLSNEEIAYFVADSVLVFWKMARIKTKTRQNCMLDVMSLWRDWSGLVRNKGRSSDPGGNMPSMCQN